MRCLRKAAEKIIDAVFGREETNSYPLPTTEPVLTKEEKAQKIINSIPSVIKKKRAERPTNCVDIMKIAGSEYGDIIYDRDVRMSRIGLRGVAAIVYDYCEAEGFYPDIMEDEDGFCMVIDITNK